MNDKNYVNTTSLMNWWFESNHSDSEKRQLFLYLDFAMRYVHDRGYCIKTLDPREIEILNDSINQVKFNVLLPMPENRQKELMNEDIFNSSPLQIGLYYSLSKDTLFKMNADFVKENFDQFVPFLPENDVPYYRGVIERNASVYFTEFELERIKRENANLQKEINELDNKD